MTRSANYTIQGFIYQFNKTLLEVLDDTEESEITVEGIIEDIEVQSKVTTKAIQCKYHETKDNFTLSCIYKPVLQMMNHFYENQDSNIEYRLYAHFPNEAVGTTRTLRDTEIAEIFSSKDKNLTKIIQNIKDKVNISEFCKRFTLEFGPSLDTLVVSVQEALIFNGMPEGDIDTLIYPNSIQVIADLSTLPNPLKRRIKKSNLLNDLLKIKKTAITRWTKELKTLDKMIKSRKIQLRTNLSKNSRLRYFVMSEGSIENFNEVIVTFISEYLGKFHFKEVHDKTPIFCLDCSLEMFNNIRVRLYRKQIKINDGFVADIFDKGKFITDPVRGRIAKGLYTEFHLKLLRYSDEAINILNENKCEDFFVFMERVPESLDIEDINIEHISLNEFEKIKFIMGMSDVYE
ncbi:MULTISPECIES: hypothetical protein [Priestia]|uniref:hypothetical protein n=1 Tax=Priestia TaxID=2800373 RepID=UPI002E1AC384|nr:hypothetical protein [Priestia aryabhattai]